MLSASTLRGWEESGFVVCRQLVGSAQCDELLAAATRVACAPKPGVTVLFEDGLPDSLPSVERVSKLFRLHRHEPSFHALCLAAPILDLMRGLIGDDVDVFLTQAVFKQPGALGQPLHQDSSIFPFEPPGPIVGVWIPLTAAGEGSSRLEVAPGSHLLGDLAHWTDPSDRTAGRYRKVLDEIATADALDLGVGDAVVFDSRLLHASTDNLTGAVRVSAVLHFAQAGTVDRSESVFGANPYNDWMAVLRNGKAVAAASA